ncbi:hypothetical protein FOV17_30570 [Pseudomonas aeruginosa]|nr:hypothetical protein [Pseudomonas aeruginosa]
MCQNCDAALPPKDICTCPSGDGSLRHPCPAHPAAEQAGGDERAAFFKHLIGRHPAHETEIVRVVEHNHAAWKAWQARAALAQPSPKCVKCGGTGEADSGGVHPWGEPVLIPCDCETEQAEAERPEAVAWQYRVTAGPQTGWSLWHPGKGEEFERSYTVERRPLMTVAQHDRIVGELRAERDGAIKLLGQSVWQKIERLTQERDAALARVAELEKQEPVATIAKVPGEDWNGLHFYRDLQGMQPGTKLYAAPVAQAQHSVPEVSGIGRDTGHPRAVVLYLRKEPTDDDLRAIHDALRSLAAAPGKEVGHE